MNRIPKNMYDNDRRMFMTIDDDLEQRKLDLEQQKFQFEKEKYKEELSTERIKTIATALSIIIPVIIAGWTINSNLDIQAKQAKYDFSLKAADIVMSAKTPAGTEARADALRDMFPDYFDENFLKYFNASKYTQSESMSIRDRKDKLMETLVLNGDLTSWELIEWWRILYPEDIWINESTSTTLSPGEDLYSAGGSFDEYPKVVS
jgi:hypothetical protein